MPPPLTSIRVIDMSRVLAGPWAGQLLGDFGADVVKIERPGSGDDTRLWGPPWFGGPEEGHAAYFLSANRNKRSVTVDFGNPAGQRVIRDLVREADVLIENFRVGTLARYGLGAADLQQLNPRLVYCTISAYGHDSPRAAEPGYDAIIQAAGGLMSITGPADEDKGGPQKVGVAIADIMAGMYAATAVLAALNVRTETGSGQFIEVPLYDSQVAWLANQAMNYLVGGRAPGRMGTAHPNLAPYQAFRTADGSLMLAVGNDRQFAACAACLGQPDLASDARFATNSARVANRQALVAALEALLSSGTTADWLERLLAAGVPAGPINTVGDVLSDDYAAERPLVHELLDASGRGVPSVANPVRFSDTGVSYRRAPPRLGEHTDEILREWLGYSDTTIAGLRRDSAI